MRRNITQIKYLELLAVYDEILRPRAFHCRKIQLGDCVSEMAERRQESRTSDSTVKITRKKRCRLEIEKLSFNHLQFWIKEI